MYKLLRSLACVLLVSMCASAALSASPTAQPAAGHFALTLLAVPDGVTITGTVSGVHYNGSGEIDRFTLTKDGVNTTIHVGTPNSSVTSAIASFLNQPADVDCHSEGNPPKLMYDGIGTPGT